jgi:hypothetical protein
MPSPIVAPDCRNPENTREIRLSRPWRAARGRKEYKGTCKNFLLSASRLDSSFLTSRHGDRKNLPVVKFSA